MANVLAVTYITDERIGRGKGCCVLCRYGGTSTNGAALWLPTLDVVVVVGVSLSIVG